MRGNGTAAITATSSGWSGAVRAHDATGSDPRRRGRLIQTEDADHPSDQRLQERLCAGAFIRSEFGLLPASAMTALTRPSSAGAAL